MGHSSQEIKRVYSSKFLELLFLEGKEGGYPSKGIGGRKPPGVYQFGPGERRFQELLGGLWYLPTLLWVKGL